MRYTLDGFKEFLEEMDPNAQKRMAGSDSDGSEHDDKEDYFSALGDEQGIEWDDLKKVFEGEPWISSHFGIGGDKAILYKMSPWEIVKGTLTPNGAVIRLKPQSKVRSYLSGNKLNKSDYVDKHKYHLNRKELMDFLTAGWTPAVQAAAGAV
jgi:hypothetical protein